MISVEDARLRVLAAFKPVEAESIALEQAADRVLAEDVRATQTQPPFPVSAMDGYAARSSDLANAPARLKIIGTAPAGHPFSGKIGAGETVRLFTGSVIPDGADTIVIQENAEPDGEHVLLDAPPPPGKHIRVAGLDFRSGVVLLRAGKKLTPRDLALLAADDKAQIMVRRNPVIAFAATGDELSLPGEARKPGGIVASSLYGLSAQIEKWGGTPKNLGILPDNIEAIAAIADTQADLIVTLGGASVGDHDLIQKALGPRGFALDFWKIAMRPGRPLIFGRLGNTPLLGLPGNPVSSLVCGQLFLKPAIAAMLGADTATSLLAARTVRNLPANDSRQDYLRARLMMRLGEYWADAFPMQDSSMQLPLAAADCLIVRAPEASALGAGEKIQILLLD